MRFTLAVFTFSFVIVYMLVRQLLPLLSRRLPDTPNARSAHQCPTPRGGGLAFVLIAGLTSVISGFAFGGLAWLPALALPLAFVGLADDRFDLPAALRYSVQLLTAVSFVVISPWVQAWPWPVLVLPVVVLAITAVINFTNFMDGLDGLVAGCMVLMLTTSFVITCRGLVSSSALFPIAALVGGLIGFLFWNWSPAKVFMGDVGSTFLGAVFAGLVLQQSSPLAALALLLVGFPLFGDAFFCVLRRGLAGQAVFRAHRLHLFQRLHQAGWSHARVAGLYIVATGLLALSLVLAGLPGVLTVAALELLLGLWLDRTVAVPFSAQTPSL